VKAKGCLIAAAIGMGIVATGLAIVGPSLVRKGEQLYRPIAKMSSAQKDFEAWSSARKYERPNGVVISAEQVDRFLKLRRQIEAVEREHPMPEEELAKHKEDKPSIEDIAGVLQGVGASISEGMDAFRKADMTPDEYGYIEGVIYRSWLKRLKVAGTDPAAIQRAAKEVSDLAGSQKDAAIAAALKKLAKELPSRRIPAPEGMPAEVHELLLARAVEIESLSDVASVLSNRRPRARVTVN
jgi:hypothetical protein